MGSYYRRAGIIGDKKSARQNDGRPDLVSGVRNYSATGKVREKIVPSPTVLSTLIAPPATP